ncbi:hypothetical protein U6A24_06655 [Aquimarina gracilis]|uniref:Uncharacterized protein n=1 Tax=Aquimarina gracilis TaxID=874422 RepID=A0ABU5ZSZ3_9FLAO|nr:hypothetical protein [Aquimarina gracilis]MEB3345130.1 hypothetical protein [Aquimarina gracilis]
MLENISNLGKPLNKTEQNSIRGGIWDSLAECEANCEGICAIGYFGNRWACFE